MNTIVDNAVKVRALSETDLKLGIAEIEGFDTVTRWSNRGKPVDDIGHETPNVAKRAQLSPGYRKVRDQMCRRYKIDEHEFVRQLLQRMSRR